LAAVGIEFQLLALCELSTSSTQKLFQQIL
jgi:hypothetical protein